MDFTSQISIDLNLVSNPNQATTSHQLPLSSSQKKRLIGGETPKSNRSRISTEALINYDSRQNAINMLRNQQIEENKKKFSEMMDLPFIVVNNEFVRRGKTFQAFKKVDINDVVEEQYKMQNIILKRSSPLQEIQTTKKLGDVFYRKKKHRQTGTVFSCELWSRSYYDHVLHKTELKPMHSKIQESAKCKNYDQRVGDVHRLYNKWEKKQPNFGVDLQNFLIPDIHTTKNTTTYLDASQNSNYNFEESCNSSKKSRFFKAVLTEPDYHENDSLIENSPQQNNQTSSLKESQSFTNRLQDIYQQSDQKKKQSALFPSIQHISKKSQVNLTKIQQPAKNQTSIKNIMSTRNISDKKIGLSQLGLSKGFLTERVLTKKGKEQNTTLSTQAWDQSTYLNDGYTIQIDDQSINKSPSFQFKKNSQINFEIFKECSYLIKNCVQYKKETKKIKRQIDEYLSEQNQDEEDEGLKKCQDQSYQELIELS